MKEKSDPCEACKKAHAKKQKAYRRTKRAESLGIPQLGPVPIGVAAAALAKANEDRPAEGSKEWELRLLRESLGRIELALHEALPREVPGLVRERRAVAVEITKLQGHRSDMKNAAGVLDELAKRRASRGTASAS
ncbi:hypothetical protein H8R18_01250 [Nanchangia anserum]|nr:hypothetical protein [Nanchangia anserum]QOX82031.1 hypothetical protein H8R18_01250 [Nanchangia anserum]